MFRAISVSALVLAAVAGAACDVHVGENGLSLDVAAGRAQDEWSRTYQLAQGGTIEVINVNGTITVEGIPAGASAGQQTVTVRAERKVRAGSDEEAKAALQKLQITEDVKADHVRVQSPSARDFTVLAPRRANISIDYHVQVPAGLRVAVKTENGGIRLQDVSGTVSAATTNGGVRGSNLAGAISAHTVNGGIVMDVANPVGGIDIDAVNGGIRLDLPASIRANVEASAVNGGVSTDSAWTFSGGEKSRNRVSGALNGGGQAIKATTVNGGVRLGIRSQTGAAATDDDPERGIVARRKS